MSDLRVPKHLDNKFVADLTSSSLRHDIVIFVKWRPSGRSNNRRAMGRILPALMIRSRDPVSLGDVDGTFHSVVLREFKKNNARSSRRGKEQTRSKTSEDIKDRRRDLMVGENP